MEERVLFGRYRLVERAGSGGSAEVWRAVDERSGEEVAIKRLHPIVFASESGRRRLVREFRALRDLRHPNVVRVRDLEMTGDDAALVLDFVDGPSLRDRLAQSSPLRPQEAVRITGDLAAALAAAHASGIVHRDVSPGNILLGEDDRARLTDFGVAHGSADETAVTATGTLVGTLRYVAPEQLRGEPATPASDLYALGAVAYEMLSGKPPFPATTPVELVEAQRAGAPPIHEVDPALDGVVRAALAADPAARPASVEAFARRLEDALDGGRTEAIAAAPTVLAGPATIPGPRAGTTGEPARGEPAAQVAVAAPHRSDRARPATRQIAAAAGLAIGGLLLTALAIAPGQDGGAARDSGPPAATERAEATAPAAEPEAEPAADKDRDDGNGGGGRGGDGGGDRGKGDENGKGKGKDKDD